MVTVTYRCQAKGCKVKWTDLDGNTARALNDMPSNVWQLPGLGGFVPPTPHPRSHSPVPLLPEEARQERRRLAGAAGRTRICGQPSAWQRTQWWPLFRAWAFGQS